MRDVYRPVTKRMDRQGGHGRRRSRCQQKASLKDNHNQRPTHCHPSSSLLSLSAPVSRFLVFFSTLFTHMHPFRCGFTSHRKTHVARLQFCGSWMYNTVSVFVCVALLIAMSIFCPLCDCPPTQQWKNKICKCQKTMNKVLEICVCGIPDQNITF